MIPDRFWMSSEFRSELKEKIKVKSYELKQKNYFTNLNKLSNSKPVSSGSQISTVSSAPLAVWVKSNMAAADNLSEFEKDALISNMMKEKAKITCDSAVKGEPKWN
ncbi:Mitochondrial aspartate/glutamate carrier protein [Porites harrisoni]